MVRTKPKLKNETLIRSLTHIPDAEEITHRLWQDATDYIGRKVSNFALLRYADTQGINWTQQTLFPFIEHELENGMVWGKKKRS